MAKSNNQKAKILFLEQMLRETGENRTVSMQEILDLLSENGITAERKSVYDDMEALRVFGLDVRFRRGRPGGYYLAGQKAAGKAAEEAENGESMAASPQVSFGQGTASAEKKMKLVYAPRMEEAVKAYFGEEADYAVREDGELVVTTALLGDPQFYGWLTAMGLDVRLIKPKKAVQNYRDYLKTLAREYKGMIG